MTNPKAEGLHTVKKWVRIPDGTKVRFLEDGREGIVDGLTELDVTLAAIRVAVRSIVSMSEIPIGHWRFRTTCWS